MQSRTTEPNGQTPMRLTLPRMLRKMMGMILLVMLTVVYSLGAVAVAAATLSGAPWYAHFMFFGFSAIAFWLLPSMLIIKWMVMETP